MARRSKQTLTRNQIETLKCYITVAVQYHSNDSEYISKRLKEIDTFLKLAAELYIIEDYSDISKIMEEVGEAGLNELDLIKRTTA